MLEISRYSPSDASSWNNFVEHSRQGTFLFNRGYMDYHSDRFTDCSLMFRQKGRLCAVLPANRVGDVLYSHQGLTYGGLLTDNRVKTTDVMEIFQTLNLWLKSNGIKHVVYKAIPWIYQRIPAQEDLYALIQVCKARLSIQEISSTILLQNRLKFEESRRSGIRKAKRSVHHMRREQRHLRILAYPRQQSGDEVSHPPCTQSARIGTALFSFSRYNQVVSRLQRWTTRRRHIDLRHRTGHPHPIYLSISRRKERRSTRFALQSHHQ